MTPPLASKTLTERLALASTPDKLVVLPGQTMCFVEEGFGDEHGIHATTIQVGERARLLYVMNIFSLNHVKRSLTMEIANGARAELLCFAGVAGNGSVQIQLREDHISGPSWGRTVVRALSFGSGVCDLRGTVTIRSAANGSDGLFEGRAMLFDPGARARILPSLEILARDVAATHAVAVGPIDPEQLFYLACRGCTIEEARGLLLAGFLEEFLNHAPADVREELRDRWYSRLPILRTEQMNFYEDYAHIS